MGSLSGIEMEFAGWIMEFAVWISGGLRNKFPLLYCEVAMDHSFIKQTCHGPNPPWKFGHTPLKNGQKLEERIVFQAFFRGKKPGTWRIIPVSKWLVTPIYKPFGPFGRGTTLLRGLTITMVINHLLTGMILQVYLFNITCSNLWCPGECHLNLADPFQSYSPFSVSGVL